MASDWYSMSVFINVMSIMQERIDGVQWFCSMYWSYSMIKIKAGVLQVCPCSISFVCGLKAKIVSSNNSMEMRSLFLFIVVLH